MRRALILAGIALAALGAVSSVAPARELFPSKVTIRHGATNAVERLEGRVYSRPYRCRFNRLVLLYRVHEDGTRKLAGEDRTDRRGYWFAVPEGGASEVPAGTYFARVRAKRIRIGRCAADRSRRIVVD